MALTLPTASRTAMISALANLLDGGKLEIRSGSRPATANDTATGTLLATVTLANPATTEANGVATLTDPAPVSAVAAGTATWFRAMTSASATVFDGSVGTSGADLNLATTSLTVGLSVDITGGTLTQPAG